MAKIAEYNRQQFASTYVGAPAEDQSGEIAVAGIGKAVGPMVEEQAKVLRERELVMIDQQANNALIKYSLNYQQRAQELELQYAGNPTAYPQAVTDMGTKLQEEFSANIPDERIRARFYEAANSVVKQGSLSAVKWTAAKQEENTTIAAKDSARLSAIVTGSTTTRDELVANISATLHMVDQIPGMTPEIKTKFEQEQMPSVLESHFYNRVALNPQSVIADLESGAYKDVPYYTDAMKVKFEALANTSIRRQERMVKYSQDENFANLTDRFIEGDLTFQRIDESVLAENPSDRIDKQDANKLRKGLVGQIEGNASKLRKADDRSRSYIDLVYSVFDNKVSRAKVLEGVIDAFADGELPPDELKFLSQIKTALTEEMESRKSPLYQKIKTAFNQQPVMKVANKISEWWKGDEAIVPQAQAVRDLIGKISKGADTNEAVKGVLNKAFKDRLSSRGIDVEHLPSSGARIVDGKGRAIWVYPDGTYKEE